MLRFPPLQNGLRDNLDGVTTEDIRDVTATDASSRPRLADMLLSAFRSRRLGTSATVSFTVAVSLGSSNFSSCNGEGPTYISPSARFNLKSFI